MWVNSASTGDWTIEGASSILEKASISTRQYLARQFRKMLYTENQNIHSISVLPSRWVKRINGSDCDVLHLHWVQAEMLSIADIGRIKKPIVWTLHDMWGFSGAEHYTEDYRWRDGYTRENRPQYESRLDVNRWTWARKYKHWKQPMHIVAPSRWLAQCVRESVLMRDWPVSVIPNPIDTELWKPLEKNFARELFGLPKDVPLLLFGAKGGSKDPRKGFDLLLEALDCMRNDPRVREMELVVFGQSSPELPPDLGFPIHYTGHLFDDVSLRSLYSAADAIVVPSRQEAFGQTASEAHACGTAVIAFNIGGLRDIVEHNRTGYLARAFDPEDLANGIVKIIAQSVKTSFSTHARERAINLFDSNLIASIYKQIYQDIFLP